MLSGDGRLGGGGHILLLVRDVLSSFGGFGGRLFDLLLRFLIGDRGFSGDFGLVGSGFSLGNPLVIDLLVFSGGSDRLFPSGNLRFLLDSLSSEPLVGDQSLNLRGFLPQGGIWVFLAFEGSSNNVLLDEGSGVYAFSFGDTEKFSDSGGSLGTKSLRHNGVGKPGNILLSLLGDCAREHGNIGANDAASDGSSLSFTLSGCPIALGARTKKEPDTAVSEDTLLHCKPIAIEATSDLEDISLELLSKVISLNFLAHPLFEEVPPAVGVVNDHCLGGSHFGVGQTELRYQQWLPSCLKQVVYNI